MKKQVARFNRKSLFLLGLILVAFVAGFLLRGGSKSEVVEKLEEVTHDHQSEIWTCSMHPQIKMPKPGQCPICFMDRSLFLR